MQPLLLNIRLPSIIISRLEVNILHTPLNISRQMNMYTDQNGFVPSKEAGLYMLNI